MSGTKPGAEFSREQVANLGEFIRQQRQKARLSLRQLAELANVSNPYLSQIERGLHEPSVRVLKAIAAGLDLSADVLLAEAGLLERVTGAGRDGAGGTVSVEAAIVADPNLSPEQKSALLGVYRSFVGT